MREIVLSALVVLTLSSVSRADDPPASGTSASAPAAEKTYTGEAATVKAHIEELFDASRKVNGPESKQARAKIEAALDWDRVAKDCLGDANWKKQNEKNRNDFRNLLKEVVVKTAYSRMDTFWKDAKYKFKKVEVAPAEGHVVAEFMVSGEPFTLEYYLVKRGPKWLVKDIAFEDLRYSVNINEQLTAFLKEKSFGELMQNLRKRRDELDSDKKDKAATEKKKG